MMPGAARMGPSGPKSLPLHRGLHAGITNAWFTMADHGGNCVRAPGVVPPFVWLSCVL